MSHLRLGFRLLSQPLRRVHPCIGHYRIERRRIRRTADSQLSALQRTCSELLSGFFSALLPELCALCGAWLTPPAQPAVCGLCRRSMPWNDNACWRCGLSADLGCAANCDDLPFERTIAPLRYEGAAARWVVRSKRRGGYPETRLLAMCLSQAVMDNYRRAQLPQQILPVPLSWQRKLRRGHNQAEALAALIAKDLQLPMASRALRRARHTPIQPGLNASQRRHNLHNAFASRHQWQGQRVAIVDDVMTSGATVSELTRVLLAAGCEAVDVWCATRAQAS
jgi:ComF family protein